MSLEELVERISYPGVRFEVVSEPGSFVYSTRKYLRVRCDDATCNVSGEAMQGWNGRKWRLSPHMTDMEVVNTAFLALLTAQEHEARELFKVDGIALMDSHRDLAQVLAFMETGGGQGRPPQLLAAVPDPTPDPRCATCGYPQSNHHFRHRFVG